MCPRTAPPSARKCAVATVAVALLGLAVPPAEAAPADCTRPSSASSAAHPWARDSLEFERAWDLGSGAGVVVAVLDTGVDAGVPQLSGRVLAGLNLLGGGPANTDCAGHGTFMAGIVAAGAQPGRGVVGVAPGARVLPVRYRDGRTNGKSASAAAAIRAGVDGGAGVVVLGAPLPIGDPGVAAAIDHAAARGALVVTPGLELRQGAAPPARLPSALLSVGGIDANGTRASASASGPIELLAPGVGVTSTSRDTGGDLVGSGDEMAAAYAAGTAALVRSYRPGLTSGQLKQRLLATATRPLTQVDEARLLEPVGAVSSVLGPTVAEAVAGPAAPIELPPPAPVDTSRERALAFSAVGLLLAAAVAAAVAAVRAGRRRERGVHHR